MRINIMHYDCLGTWLVSSNKVYGALWCLVVSVVVLNRLSCSVVRISGQLWWVSVVIEGKMWWCTVVVMGDEWCLLFTVMGRVSCFVSVVMGRLWCFVIVVMGRVCCFAVVVIGRVCCFGYKVMGRVWCFVSVVIGRVCFLIVCVWVKVVVSIALWCLVDVVSGRIWWLEVKMWATMWSLGVAMPTRLCCAGPTWRGDMWRRPSGPKVLDGGILWSLGHLLPALCWIWRKDIPLNVYTYCKISIVIFDFV